MSLMYTAPKFITCLAPRKLLTNPDRYKIVSNLLSRWLSTDEPFDVLSELEWEQEDDKELKYLSVRPPNISFNVCFADKLFLKLYFDRETVDLGERKYIDWSYKLTTVLLDLRKEFIKFLHLDLLNLNILSLWGILQRNFKYFLYKGLYFFRFIISYSSYMGEQRDLNPRLLGPQPNTLKPTELCTPLYTTTKSFKVYFWYNVYCIAEPTTL